MMPDNKSYNRDMATRSFMLRLTLVGVALLCSALAFLLAVLIIVPAPAYRLWQVAVVVSEWSLWVGLLGGLGAVLGLVAVKQGTRWGRLAIAQGLLAVAIASVPSLQAQQIARANNINLSLSEYLVGLDDSAASPAFETVTYATVAGQPLKLDVFRSRTEGGARPAIVVIHGGSWHGGDKTDFPQWDVWLADHGFVVFDIQYRLAPQPNWQSATGDVKCALDWIRRHAAEYGVDPQRIALLGRSAGGHLALLAAYTPGNAALASSCGGPDEPVQAVVSLYGPADLVWGYNNPANPSVIDGPGTLRRFLGGTPESAADRYRLASPITHVSHATPPTLLLHGGSDQLVGQQHSELLAERLDAEQVPHQTVFIPYGQHGFDYNFHGWSAQIIKPVILNFLQSHLAFDRQR